ncbi:hypothetical protein CW304_26165 [Bacillus sp. UFRGS-B20]|nr:hypothetical protein CW304_26165 [Bacillus sp. UFRGS-B20]
MNYISYIISHLCCNEIIRYLYTLVLPIRYFCCHKATKTLCSAFWMGCYYGAHSMRLEPNFLFVP